MKNNQIDQEINIRCSDFATKYRKVLKLIKKYNRIAIFRHIRPDYDAIGSQLGLAYYLKDNFPDKEIIYTGEDHVSLTPRCFEKMMEVNDEWFNEPFLAIILDTSNSNRISDVRYKRAKTIIKIDHHPDVDHYGDVEVVDPTMSAAGELLANMLIKFEGYKINKECATNIYKAIAGDSNRFLYAEVNAHTFAVAKYLCNAGIDLPKIYNEMYSEDISSLEFTKWVLANYRISQKGIAYYVLKKADLEHLKLPAERAKDCLYLFDHFDNIHIWLSVSYDEAKASYRVSLRSNGIDVEKVATKYRGGGHLQASGAKLKSLDELPDLIKDLEDLIK